MHVFVVRFQVLLAWTPFTNKDHSDVLVQDCSISSALAMEILQSCTKLSEGY